MISLYGNNKVLDYYISCMLYMAYMISDILSYHIGDMYDGVHAMWVIYLTIKAVILAILGVWFELYIEKMSKYTKRGCA